MPKDLAEQIRDAAEVLRSFGAKEVYLFGSACTDQMTSRSDVDMAVAGLPPAVFFRAYAQASLRLDREMDLIDLDQDDPFTRHLRAYGELRRVG